MQVPISGNSKGGPAPINIQVTSPDGTQQSIPSSIDADGNYAETLNLPAGIGYKVQVSIPEDSYFFGALSEAVVFDVAKEDRGISVKVN